VQPGQEIKNSAEGMKYLESTLLMVPGTPYITGALASALFQISMLPGIKTSCANMNTVQVVAFMLLEINLEKKVNAITEAVMMKLDNQIKSLKDKTTAVTTAIRDKVTQIADTLKTQIATVVETTAEEIKTATQEMNDMSTKLAETTTKYRDTLTGPTTTGRMGTSQINTINAKLRAWEGIRKRQILINFEPTDSPETCKDNSTKTIKAKANKAIKETSGELTDHKIKAVTKLRNRGILMELNSDEAVEWLQEDKNCKIFMEKFNANMIIKPRSFHTIVQFLPLTFRRENPTDIQEIEEANGLRKGNIQKARWIKPIAHRSPSQICGHLIFTLMYA
jgi:hypothetical protein